MEGLVFVDLGGKEVRLGKFLYTSRFRCLPEAAAKILKKAAEPWKYARRRHKWKKRRK